MTNVLIVEDDERLRVALRGTFRAQYIDVVEAPSGEDALLALARGTPDLVLLDLRLPGMSGVETLRELRRVSSVPVVVLTVHYELHDKLDAFAAGADDYIVKPFEPEELLARVHAQLRRSLTTPSTPRVFRARDVEVDLHRRQVTRAGATVRLGQLEYQVLELLAANPGRLQTHNELIEKIWSGRASDARIRLRATILSLRRKLGEDIADPQLIFTEPGIGYRWIGPQDLGGHSAAGTD